MRVHQILAEVRAQFEIDKYMPDLSGDKLPDREFVINVGKAFNHPNNSTVNTLIPDLLQDMIKRALEAREVKYTSRRNIKMRILPEFKRMFDETKEVSSKNLFWSKIIGCNGRFYQLVRNTSRRRQSRQEKTEQTGEGTNRTEIRGDQARGNLERRSHPKFEKTGRKLRTTRDWEW